MNLALDGVWSQLDPTDLTGSWLAVSTQASRIVIAGQFTAASFTERYMADSLAALDLDAPHEGRVNARAFAGTASDGRPLGSLLYSPITTVKARVAAGMDLGEAMQAGRYRLGVISQTLTTDAGRQADSAAITARPAVESYVRTLSPPTCSRCAVLAGRKYRWSQGFKRHPRCFPAGVLVSGPRREATARRWFEGELVLVTTASGQQLSVTGNHPVLTDRGWIPANLLQEGDNVVRSILGQGATPLVVPHERQVPARIEEGWRADLVGPLGRMPTTAEDFHGDGGHGDVDVVLADGLLGYGLESSGGQPRQHPLFTGGLDLADGFDADRMAAQLLIGTAASSGGGVAGGGLLSTLLGGHLGCPHQTGRAATSDLHLRGHKVPPDDVSRHSVAARQGVLALATTVGSSDFLGEQTHRRSLPRWDAPGTYSSVESALAYASRGQDLLHRLAGQVELDRVVDVRRTSWSGHVYSLTSSEGWHTANQLIVSNCDCGMLPAPEAAVSELVTDPMAAYRAGQVRDLTKAQARALDDGADFGKVVNANRKGAGLTTTEGAKGGRTRLTPDGIYRRYEDRADAIDALRRYGYII